MEGSEESTADSTSNLRTTSQQPSALPLQIARERRQQRTPTHFSMPVELPTGLELEHEQFSIAF
jgi:hypothetical protein